jgi:hypothetical protein
MRGLVKQCDTSMLGSMPCSFCCSGDVPRFLPAPVEYPTSMQQINGTSGRSMGLKEEKLDEKAPGKI